MKIKVFFNMFLLSFLILLLCNISVSAALPNSLSSISQIGDEFSDSSGYGLKLKVSTSQNLAVIGTEYSKENSSATGITCNLIQENNGMGWDNATRYGVAAIINASKSSIDPTQITKQYFLAELAINKFLYDASSGGENIGSLSSIYNSEFNKYLKIGKDAYNDYQNASKLSASLSESELTFTLDGDNYVSNEIAVSGGTFEKATSTLGEVERMGNKFRVIIPSSLITKDEDISVEVTVSKELDQARNYSCGQNYQSITPVKTETIKIVEKKKITSNIKQLGRLVINTYNHKNEYLSGATIKVTGNKGYNQTFVTNGNSIIINNLQLDTYTVEELSAPSGYIKPTSQSLTITESKTQATINLVNKAIKLSVFKLDKDKNTKLKGAILKLTDKEGNILSTCRDERNKEVLCKWITKEDAYVIEALPIGTYYLVEESAPKGYNISNKKVKIEILEDGKINVDGKISEDGIVNFYNSLTRLEISKISDITGKALSGSTFEILDSKEKPMNCKTIDEDGKIKSLDNCTLVSGDKKTVVVGLSKGEYYLVEKKASEGYEINEEKVKFEIKADGTSTKVKTSNNLVVNVPDILSSRSALLVAISMFDMALGIGIIAYVKKNKVKE